MLRTGLAAVSIAMLLWVAPSARAQPPTPAITLTAAPSSTFSGQRVTLSGRASNTPPGSEVQLYANPYPYPAAAPVATTQANPDGSFSFTEYPDRNIRFMAYYVHAHADPAAFSVGKGAKIDSDLVVGRVNFYW